MLWNKTTRRFLCVFFSLQLLFPYHVWAADPCLNDANEWACRGRRALMTGYIIEKTGNYQTAVAAYGDAARLSTDALNLRESLHFYFYENPSGIYFLHGQVKLALAQAYAIMGYHFQMIREELLAAEKSFLTTVKVVDLRHQHKNGDWAQKRADAVFALSAVDFLLGKETQAREGFSHILTDLDPKYAPAIYALESMDYISGRRSDNISSTGVRFPDLPYGKMGGYRLLSCVVEIGKAGLGRWGTAKGALAEELF